MSEFEDDYGWSDDAVVCPYCGHEHEILGDYESDGTYECAECDKSFDLQIETSYNYSTTRIKAPTPTTDTETKP